MAKTLQQKMTELKPARRRRVEARSRSLIAEEMVLAELRQGKALTQTKMSEALGIGQEGVSRLEKRSDLLISTLRGYVEAMGGRLRLIADFPDRASVELAGFAAIEAARNKRAKKQARPVR
jgi:transcriptional regulator with XRE-family HTH domain